MNMQWGTWPNLNWAHILYMVLPFKKQNLNKKNTMSADVNSV